MPVPPVCRRYSHALHLPRSGGSGPAAASPGAPRVLPGESAPPPSPESPTCCKTPPRRGTDFFSTGKISVPACPAAFCPRLEGREARKMPEQPPELGFIRSRAPGPAPCPQILAEDRLDLRGRPVVVSSAGQHLKSFILMRTASTSPPRLSDGFSVLPRYQARLTSNFSENTNKTDLLLPGLPQGALFPLM